jgi:hypothetical protein
MCLAPSMLQNQKLHAWGGDVALATFSWSANAWTAGTPYVAREHRIGAGYLNVRRCCTAFFIFAVLDFLGCHQLGLSPQAERDLNLHVQWLKIKGSGIIDTIFNSGEPQSTHKKNGFKLVLLFNFPIGITCNPTLSSFIHTKNQSTPYNVTWKAPCWVILSGGLIEFTISW